MARQSEHRCLCEAATHAGPAEIAADRATNLFIEAIHGGDDRNGAIRRPQHQLGEILRIGHQYAGLRRRALQPCDIHRRLNVNGVSGGLSDVLRHSNCWLATATVNESPSYTARWSPTPDQRSHFADRLQRFIGEPPIVPTLWSEDTAYLRSPAPGTPYLANLDARQSQSSIRLSTHDVQ